MKTSLNQKFQQWLQTSTGHAVQAIEFKLLKKLKQSSMSRSVLIIGEPAHRSFFNAFNDINENLLVSAIRDEAVKEGFIQASAEELPLLPNSMDFVVLPHTLDFSRRPSHVLREVNICLQPEGYLVILGFNPYSLWGLRRIFSMRLQAPWCAHFYPLWKLKDMLNVLSYDVVLTKKTIYRPHAKRFGLFRQFIFLESIIRLLFPFAGSVYLVVAKKKVFGMTPLRARWRAVSSIIPKGAVNPTRTIARQDVHDV